VGKGIIFKITKIEKQNEERNSFLRSSNVLKKEDD